MCSCKIITKVLLDHQDYHVARDKHRETVAARNLQIPKCFSLNRDAMGNDISDCGGFVPELKCLMVNQPNLMNNFLSAKYF